jgi:serine/threonine protein kinase
MKISDFGLSRYLAGGQSQSDMTHGTEAYLPLEVFKESKITEATDVYALGLVMWEIFYGMFWFSVYDHEKKRRKCFPPLSVAFESRGSFALLFLVESCVCFLCVFVLCPGRL